MAYYLSSLYMRHGRRGLADYIDAAVACSPPELKDLAAKIAREILQGAMEKPRRAPSWSMGFSRSLQKVMVANAGSGQDRYLRWHAGLCRRWPEQLLHETASSIIRIARRFQALLDRNALHGEILRPYEPGDDPEAVDMDETIRNLLERMRRKEEIVYDDIAVRIHRERRRNVIILHDISGSMGQSIIATNMALTAISQAFLRGNLAIGLFRDDFYVMKGLQEVVEPFPFAEETLTLCSEGGTVLAKGLEWTREQFRLFPDDRDICFILGDFDFYDPVKTRGMLEEMGSRRRVIGLSIGSIPAVISDVITAIDLVPIWLSSRTAEDFVQGTLDRVSAVLNAP